MARPSRKKKEKAPAPLPFKSEAFERDSRHKKDRIKRALASADEKPVPSIPDKAESFFEIEEDSLEAGSIATNEPAPEKEAIKNIKKKAAKKQAVESIVVEITDDSQLAEISKPEELSLRKEEVKEEAKDLKFKEAAKEEVKEPTVQEEVKEEVKEIKVEEEFKGEAKGKQEETKEEAREEAGEARARPDAKEEKIKEPESKEEAKEEKIKEPEAKEKKAASVDSSVIDGESVVELSKGEPPKKKRSKRRWWPWAKSEKTIEELPPPKPLRPKRRAKKSKDDPFSEDVRRLFEEEEELQKEVHRKEEALKEAQEAERVEEEKPKPERRRVFEPGSFIAKPKEEELTTKKVSSRSLAETAAEREKERERREKERKKRRSKRAKGKEERRDKEQKTAQKESRRERARRRREERERARKEKAAEEARALYTSADKHHWTKGLPVLESIYRWRTKKEEEKQSQEPKKRKTPRIVRVFRDMRRRQQAEQARKLWEDIVGLDIGASYIRAVLVEKGEVVLAEREIPDGIIVRGILEEPEELASELRSLWKEEGISSRKVNISFSNRLTVLRTLELQAESEEDIKQALALNADTLVKPMRAEDVVIDYAQLSRTGPGASLQVAAADRDMVEEFVGAVEDGGLTVAGAEVGPLTVNRALRVPRKKDSANVLLDVGSETTSFAVASGPDVFFLRVLEVGGNDFTRAIVKQTNLSWFKAEELKRKISSGEALSSSEVEAQRALLEVSDRFCQEVLETESLYRDTPRARSLEGYLLLGGGGSLAGLDEQLSFVLNKPVNKEVSVNPRFENLPISFASWAPAVGLASGHSMSLLPERRGRFGRDNKRRTSKISAEEAQERARVLAAGDQKPLTSKKMLVILALSLGLLGAFLWGEKIKSDSESVKNEAAVLQNVAPAEQEPSQAEILRRSLDEAPSWSQTQAVFEKAEQEGIQVLEFFVLGRETRIFFRDARTTAQLEDIFDTPEADVSVSENAAGEKELVVRT